MQTVRKIALYAVALVVALLLASFTASQCRAWRTPKPPKPIPAQIDPGAPVPGPISESPTVTTCLPTAVPDLTRAQVAELARKYGLTTVSRKPDALGGDLRHDLTPVPGGPDAPLATGEIVAQAGGGTAYPIPLAQEVFRHEASGVSIEVSGWLPGPGERVDLRGLWGEWQPPVPAVDEGYFDNVARFEKGFLAGYVGIKAGEETIAEPGIGFHLRYRGWRIGKATLDAGGLGMLTASGDGAAMGGVGLSWP